MAANGGMASSSWPTSLAVAAFSSSIRVACPTASGRSANRMSFTSSANRSKSASPDSSTAFAVAASRMVFPQRLAAITAMGSSGTHCISQSSWNVPLAVSYTHLAGEQVWSTGEGRDAEAGEFGGEGLVVEWRAFIAQGEKGDDLYAGLYKLVGALEQVLFHAAFVEVGNENKEMCIRDSGYADRFGKRP